MKIEKIFVTGDSWAIYRHQFLWKPMSLHFNHIEVFSRSESILIKAKAYSSRIINAIAVNENSRLTSFHKSKEAFTIKSQQIERKIRRLKYTPDLVFHLHGMYCPFWNKFDIPYTMFLDYTMSLAEKVWPPWAPFADYRERNEWIDLERKAYERAHHLFAVSNLVKSSLITDYGIAPNKISTVGVSGNFEKSYEGPKTFGSKQILFNGSDFARKGGDVVLAAFRIVKQMIPEAKLIIVGKSLNIEEDGVINVGSISSRSDIFNLFLGTDLVVAPARCDPFPLFVIEAMNYGIPCVVSANDGMPEIVDNEVNGIVADQSTSEFLANQIVSLLSDTSVLISMSKEARQKVKNQFNWDTVSKNIIQVLSN